MNVVIDNAVLLLRLRHNEMIVEQEHEELYPTSRYESYIGLPQEYPAMNEQTILIQQIHVSFRA